MRLIFMGTSGFAVPSLEHLADSSHSVSGVVTQPDRPAGRGQKLRGSPVSLSARAHELPLLQPDSLESDSFRDYVEASAPDAIVVVAYGKLLPGWLIRYPPLGALNLHGSLLPRYRGAAPVNWAIVRGETRTGVCAMQMDEGLDTGPVYGCREVDIRSEESAPELLGRLSRLGAGLLLETLQSLESGQARVVPQCDAEATLAPQLRRADGYVLWEEPAVQIHNKIRGLYPWPSVVVGFRAKTCRLLESRVGDPAEGEGEPGSIRSVGGRLSVRCGDSRMLELVRLQLENRKAGSAADFVNGCHLGLDERFTSLASREDERP